MAVAARVGKATAMCSTSNSLGFVLVLMLLFATMAGSNEIDQKKLDQYLIAASHKYLLLYIISCQWTTVVLSGKIFPMLRDLYQWEVWFQFTQHNFFKIHSIVASTQAIDKQGNTALMAAVSLGYYFVYPLIMFLVNSHRTLIRAGQSQSDKSFIGCWSTNKFKVSPWEDPFNLGCKVGSHAS